MAEMMWGCFQCGIPEADWPTTKSLSSATRKRSEVALRLIRFSDASVNDLVNCLAIKLISIE